MTESFKPGDKVKVKRDDRLVGFIHNTTTRHADRLFYSVYFDTGELIGWYTAESLELIAS